MDPVDFIHSLLENMDMVGRPHRSSMLRMMKNVRGVDQRVLSAAVERHDTMVALEELECYSEPSGLHRRCH